MAIESFPSIEKDFRVTGQRLKGTYYVESPPGEADLVLPFLPGRAKPQISEPQLELVPGVDFQAVFVPTNYKQATMVAPGPKSSRHAKPLPTPSFSGKRNWTRPVRT